MARTFLVASAANAAELELNFDDALAPLLAIKVVGLTLSLTDEARRNGTELRATLSYDTGATAMASPFRLKIFLAKTLTAAKADLDAFAAANPTAFISGAFEVTMTGARRTASVALAVAYNASAVASANWAVDGVNGGGGGGAVASVNGQVGVVVLGASDVGAAAKASNLSDLASIPTARTNLGLGDSATKNTGTSTGTVAAGDDVRLNGNAPGALAVVAITDNGNGTITTGAVDVLLFPAASWAGTLLKATVAGLTSASLADNSSNYLVADYNGGAPIQKIITDPTLINGSSVVMLSNMYRIGTAIHTVAVDWGLSTASRTVDRQIQVMQFERSSGLSLSETAGRVINIGSGVVWYGPKPISEAAVTSASNNADFWYRVAGVWTTSLASDYNNSQYDNGTALVALGSNDYGVVWVYRYIDGSALPKIAYVLGSASYSNLAGALAATPTTPPTILQRQAILVGRIIIRQGAATATQIDSAFTAAFAGSTVTDHNSLAGRDTAASHPASAISGLGGAALLNVGTTTGTVAAGDDTRFLAGTGYNAGNLTGAVTLNALNGLVQRGTLTGDVGLSNITGQPAASTFTLIVAASGADRLLTLAASMIDLRDGQGSKALTVRNGQTLVLEMAYSGLNWYYATSAPAEVVFRPMDNEPPASAFATIDLRNSHPVLDFDDTTAESAVFTGVMPTGYGSGPLSVILRWAATSATTGNVKWNVAFETMPTGVLDIDADDFAAVQTVTTAANATSGVMSRTTITFTNAQADAVAAGVAFRIKVTRDAADAADTMVGDAELVAVTVTEA